MVDGWYGMGMGMGDGVGGWVGGFVVRVVVVAGARSRGGKIFRKRKS